MLPNGSVTGPTLRQGAQVQRIVSVLAAEVGFYRELSAARFCSIVAMVPRARPGPLPAILRLDSRGAQRSRQKGIPHARRGWHATSGRTGNDTLFGCTMLPVTRATALTPSISTSWTS